MAESSSLGGMTRRAALYGMGAVAAIAGPGTGIGVRAAETPRRGGRLRLGWPNHGPNDTLDPTRITNSLDFVRAMSLMSTLVRLTPEGTLTPELAESWESSPDATEWTFRLRKDVVFHNGKTFGPEDVIYTVSRHVAPDSRSTVKSWFLPIDRMWADGPNVLRMKLKVPNVDLPATFSWPDAVIYSAGTTDFSLGVGTGPFKMKEFRPGIGMLATRNENYFKQGLPYLDEFETFGIPDENARINALVTGDIHLLPRLGAKAVPIVNASSLAEIVSTRAGRHPAVCMMLDRAPTDNLDLRLAIKHLADRQGMLRGLLKGYGVLGNDVPIPPFHKYYNTELPQRSQDLDKAKFHFRKSGAGSIPLTLATSDAAGGEIAVEIAAFMQQSAAQAGIKVEVNRQPGGNYWTGAYMKTPMFLSGWSPRPTADLIFTQQFHSTSTWNETQMKRPELDAMIEQARGMQDEARRKQVYWDIQKVVYDEGGTLVPVFTDFIAGKSRKLRGMVPTPYFDASFNTVGEQAWFEG